MQKARSVSMIYYGLALTLFAFAIMQANDPDYLIWIPVYMLPSVMCLLAARKIEYPTVSLVICTLYSGAGIWLWPEEFSGMGTMTTLAPQVEEARESMGLLLSAAIWLGLYCAGRKPRYKGSQRKSR